MRSQEPIRAPGPLALMELKKKPAHHPKIREASFEDYPQITSLASRYGLGTKSYEGWRHLWINNPVYIAFQRDWPIGWVLESADKQILGYVGNIPLLYEFQARKIIAASAHEWVVDSDYRSYSILLMSHYFDQKNVDLYLNTTVNSTGSKAFSVFRSLKVPVGAWDQSDFWITHYQGFASSWLNMRALPMARALSCPLSVALYFSDKIAKETFRIFGTNRNGVEVEPCINFDHRFDAFWEALKRKNSHQLLGVRTREMLEWHFRNAILQDKLWILTVMDGSDLAAYGIFYRQDNTSFGLKRVRLVDFQALDERGHDLLLPMLSFALGRCQSERIHMLECVGLCPAKREVSGKLAPYQRRLSSWFYYYKVKDQGLAESLKDPKVWDPSCFDGDASL